MIHHVHSTLLTETSASTGPTASALSDKSAGESFEGVLSDAVNPDRGPSVAHQAAKDGEEMSGKSLIRGPINPDKLVRPPSENSAPSTSGSTVSIGVDPLKSSSPTTAGTASATTTSSAAPVDAQEAFDNAYWASQPAAVQALRTMPDGSQKTALAAQLASEGYSIDVPIMVWGWDPSIVTSMRQAEGYTWVPSALQSPVEMLPGLHSMGSMTAYNPNNPPPGSIAV